MTPDEKTTAISILNSQIPASQSLDYSGRYTQVKQYNVEQGSVTYTLRLDQYLTPSGGAGYCRYISCPEDGDPDLINGYADPFGPEPWASGWSSGRGNG
jgi:hypothetical protein